MTNVLKRNNVTVLGLGSQPMMFAHGFGCDQNMWLYIINTFVKDYKIILFDHVGSGKSDLSAYDFDKYSKLDAYASDVLEIIDALQLKDVIFVGHSVSCTIGQIAANERPELFSQLIHIGPSPRYIHAEGFKSAFSEKDLGDLLGTMDNNYIVWANYVAPLIMGNPERAELGQELAKSFCETDSRIAKHFARVTFHSDNREDFAKSKVPGLIMQCAQDIIAPEEVGRYIQANTPQTSLYLMKATGHCPHVSHPIETVNAMKKYLESVKAVTV
jgi:sigma-B regulation protein RsbQ